MNHDPATPAVNRRTGTVVVLTLIAAVVLATLWLWRAHGDDVAPASGGVDSVAATGAADPAATAPSASLSSPIQGVAVQRESAGAARVTGVVLDASGEPLEGASVVLRRLDVRPPKPAPLLPLRSPGSPINFARERQSLPAFTASDASGAFGFADVAAAEYTLTAALGGATSQTFTLASGEHRRVELRFAATETMLFGQVRGSGIGPGTHYVEVSHGHQPRMLPVEPDGGFRGLVEAGMRVVRVKQRMHSDSRSSHFVALDERRVEFEPGMRRRCDFDLVSGRIDVVPDVQGSVSPSMRFIARGRCGIDGDEVVQSRTAVGTGVAFEHLPLGEWHVALRGPGDVVEVEERVELTSGRPTAQVVLKVLGAGILRVSARDLQGQNVTLVDAGLLLATSRGERGGTDLARERGLGVAADFGFVGVPLGRAELVCEDRDVEGRRLFLPFDPLPRQAVDVVAGDGNRVELRVERRAFAQLRAVDRVGREDRTARIAVFAGEREVAAAEGSRASFWRAHLPPGDYRILVERSGASREHGLQVGRQNLEWKLRP